jgi:hypothetical protein
VSLPGALFFCYIVGMANPRLPKSKQHSTAGATQNGRVLDKPRVARQWEVCSVWDYSPQAQTYTVVGGSAGPIPDVRRLVEDPGVVGVLPRGTEVVVHFELGFPAIAAVLKSAATGAVEVNPSRISEIRGVGGEDGVYDQKNPSSNARAPNDPVDVMADDWVRKGRHNNFVGVLAGGTNILSSSPMAQIRTHGVNDMVEVFANVYRHISALGNLEIHNDGGKTSLTWRAGSDQATENGANAENWTLRLDAGATGDLFRLSVTTPNNNTLCELHMSADGRLSLTGVAGVDISSGTRGTAREDVAEHKETSVLGNMATTVGGAVTENFKAGRETTIMTNDALSTGSDLKETIGHDRMTHIANTLKTTVEGGGKSPPPDEGNLAILWDAVNGGIESVTGNPKSGATSSPKQAQNFVNYAGDFRFVTPSGFKWVLMSADDDSVLLAADGSATAGDKGHTFSVTTPKHHACMWEEFEKVINAIMDWADDHVHLTAMGPSGPAKSSATGPMTAKVKEKIEPVKSTRVMIGG